MSLSHTPFVRSLLVGIAGKSQLSAFTRASRRLKETQKQLLLRIISSCRHTVFGKEHRFETLHTPEDFRRAVPVRTYEGHHPYVERMCRGESDVLFTGKPLFYTTTSGTTSKPKLIPIGKDYFAVYNNLTRLWLYTCLRDNPRLYHGQSLSAVSPAEEGKVEDGTPYGSISGVTYRNIPAVLKSTYTTPYPVICIRDYHQKYYAMMRYGLGDTISFIISASPSNVVRLHQTAMEQFDDLLKDIRDGTLRKNALEEIEPGARQEVLAGLSPDPARARELEALYRKHGDALRPKHYWPELACVNTWKQGNFAALLPRLDGFFSESTAVRAFGYWASEGRGGLILGNDWNYSVLAGHAHVFEFIPESERESANPQTIWPHQVEVGKRYFILYTNGSGLYRYDINDLVEVIGFYNELPLFRFIRKGEGVTSLTGEKITEPQVIQATAEAADVTGARVHFYTLFCDERAGKYRLFVEFDHDCTPRDRKKFASAFDERMRLINREYEIKRGSHRLGAPALEELRSGSYELLKESLIANGFAREGQYKESFLRRRAELLPLYTKLAV